MVYYFFYTKKNGNEDGRNALIEAMRECGVTLKFWKEKKEKKYEWISLMGEVKQENVEKAARSFS